MPEVRDCLSKREKCNYLNDGAISVHQVAQIQKLPLLILSLLQATKLAWNFKTLHKNIKLLAAHSPSNCWRCFLTCES